MGHISIETCILLAGLTAERAERRYIMQKIFGKYEQDENFTTVYSNNTVYTIARNTGDWGCVVVGRRTATGHILTQDVYDEWESACEKEGTFVLS